MATCIEEQLSPPANSIAELEDNFNNLNLNQISDNINQKIFEKHLEKELFTKCKSAETPAVDINSNEKNSTESTDKNIKSSNSRHESLETSSQKKRASRIRSAKLRMHINREQAALTESFESLTLGSIQEQDDAENSRDANCANSMSVRARGPEVSSKSVKNINRHSPMSISGKERQHRLHLSGCSAIIQDNAKEDCAPVLDIRKQTQLFNIPPVECCNANVSEQLAFSYGSPDSGFGSPFSEVCFSPPSGGVGETIPKQSEDSYDVLSPSVRERVTSSATDSRSLGDVEGLRSLKTILLDLYRKNDTDNLNSEECERRLNDICDLFLNEYGNGVEVLELDTPDVPVSPPSNHCVPHMNIPSDVGVVADVESNNYPSQAESNVNLNVPSDKATPSAQIFTVPESSSNEPTQNTPVIINNIILPVFMVPMVTKNVQKVHSLPPLLPKPSRDKIQEPSPRSELRKVLDIVKKTEYQKEIYNKIRGKKRQDVILIKDKAQKQTNLHIAAKNSDRELVYCLVEIQFQINKNKAPHAVNVCDNFGKTARDYSTDPLISSYLDMFKPKEKETSTKSLAS